jgi:ubiquinone/menaquinone biosynthesis C-methylase UbiE
LDFIGCLQAIDYEPSTIDDGPSTMDLYRRFFLPRLIHYAMARDRVAHLRAASIPSARGAVLEIGIGSGLNLPYYTGDVVRLYGVDPSRELLAMARARVERAPFPVELIERGAERLPLPDASIDTAVTTWTLCSIGDPSAALGEIRRVLRPSAALIFVEHGLSPDAAVQKWQNRVTPAWRHVAGGCHLNRRVDRLIVEAGFEISELQTNYLPGPRMMTFVYAGRARTPANGPHG